MRNHLWSNLGPIPKTNESRSLAQSPRSHPRIRSRKLPRNPFRRAILPPGMRHDLVHCLRNAKPDTAARRAKTARLTHRKKSETVLLGGACGRSHLWPQKSHEKRVLTTKCDREADPLGFDWLERSTKVPGTMNRPIHCSHFAPPLVSACGRSSTAELGFSKPQVRVRFPSPAPTSNELPSVVLSAPGTGNFQADTVLG